MYAYEFFLMRLYRCVMIVNHNHISMRVVDDTPLLLTLAFVVTFTASSLQTLWTCTGGWLVFQYAIDILVVVSCKVGVERRRVWGAAEGAGWGGSGGGTGEGKKGGVTSLWLCTNEERLREGCQSGYGLLCTTQTGSTSFVLPLPVGRLVGLVVKASASRAEDPGLWPILLFRLNRVHVLADT